MQRFRDRLLSGEPLDLSELLRCRSEDVPFLEQLSQTPYRGCSALEVAEATMGRLRREPPPPLPAAADPALRTWWSPWPALYAAALFRHVGLAEARREAGSSEEAVPEHAGESALAAREHMRHLGLPFAVRESAVALIRSQRKPVGLIASGAPAESYMRLACALDCRCLYRLLQAEHAVLEREEGEREQLEAFRRKAHELGVFDRPWPPAVSRAEAAAAGYRRGSERLRVRNASRYFELVADMSEPEWFEERLREQLRRPRGRLHLLVGPAATGKSTWAQAQLEGLPIVSSDRMRRELTGDPADQSQNYLVFQRCMDRVRERLKDGQEVLFDATNYSEKLRSMPVQAARWSAAQIVSYFFDVGLSETLRRNRKRRRSVPPEVIRKHFRLLEPPLLYESDCHMVVVDDGDAVAYWPRRE